MTEVKPVAWATALALLGVKNAEYGRRPRVVLLSRECAGGRRIGLILDADHERVVAELRAENERLRKSRNEFYHAAEGRRLANSDLRRRNAELQARVAELERFHDVVQTAMQIHVIDEDAINWIEQQLATMQGGRRIGNE